jgi:hypothetical protein
MRVTADEIWTDHLAGLSEQQIAEKHRILVQTVRYTVFDLRSKYPRQVEEQAMRAFVRNCVAQRVSTESIRDRVWDIYRMAPTAADIREIVSPTSEQSLESSQRALGGRRRARRSKKGNYTADLPTSVTTALCASTEDSLPTLEKEAKRLVRQTPPASKRFSAVREAREEAQFLAVEDVPGIVNTLLDEF